MNGYEFCIRKGQYWIENNSKYEGQRIVQVLEVRQELVRIKTIVQKLGKYKKAGYVTWTHKARFNGKQGGYTYLPDNTESTCSDILL